MMNRDQYAEKLKAQIDRLNSQVDKLESKAASMRSKLEKQIAEVRSKREEVESKLEQIRQAGGEAWLTLKDGAERARQALTEALKKARAKFS